MLNLIFTDRKSFSDCFQVEGKPGVVEVILALLVVVEVVEKVVVVVVVVAAVVVVVVVREEVRTRSRSRRITSGGSHNLLER